MLLGSFFLWREGLSFSRLQKVEIVARQEEPPAARVGLG
jgi:hypothetical protein